MQPAAKAVCTRHSNPRGSRLSLSSDSRNSGQKAKRMGVERSSAKRFGRTSASQIWLREMGSEAMKAKWLSLKRLEKTRTPQAKPQQTRDRNSTSSGIGL